MNHRLGSVGSPVAVCVAALLLAYAGRAGADDARPRPPHVVIILADDLGWGDVSCNNSDRGKLNTPHIDRIAAEGMRFTDAHSSSGVCSPSRYTLLTGRYHWRSRLQQGIVGYLEGPLISPDRLTLGRMLQQRGYRTACIGKWHLGWDWDIPKQQRALFAPPRNERPEATDRHRAAWRAAYSRPIAGGPTTRGFDEYFGTDVPNWPPYAFIENDATLGVPSEFLPEELLTNQLASLPGPALPGWKFEQVLPTITDRACEFISRSAAAGGRFFLYFPLTTPHTPLAVNEPWRGRSGLGARAADLILETDAMVGRVLDALDKAGIADDTLVLFTSDNGFAPYAGAAELEAQGHFPSGPFRGYKADAWEGGHRVPFLVRWPGNVAAAQTCHQLVHHADVVATLAEIVGFELPPSAGEDSFSLMPLLRGSHAPVRPHAISHASSGLPALRQGEWKILFGPGGGGFAGRRSRRDAAAPSGPTDSIQLYNLATDPGEQQNLAGEEPQRVAEMTALMDRLVTQGRSTAGPGQKNDVPVQWRRLMERRPTP
jgi:arylsulfatase A-like enzyme